MREHLDGDFAHGAEFTAVARDALGNKTFIKNGCEVSEGTGAFEVDISAGTAFINGASVAVGADTKVISSEDTFTRRYDLLTVDGTGNVQVTEGTADSTAPPIPEDETIIAIIIIDKDVTGIGSGDIKDVRILHELFAIDPHGNAAHDPDFTERGDFDDHVEDSVAHRPETFTIAGRLADVPTATWTLAGRFYTKTTTTQLLAIFGKPFDNPLLAQGEIRLRRATTTLFSTDSEHPLTGSPLADLSAVPANTLIDIEVYNDTGAVTDMIFTATFAHERPTGSDW